MPTEDKKFYSKDELEEFRLILNQKILDAENEVENHKQSLLDLSDNTVDTNDMGGSGQVAQEKQFIEVSLARQNKFLLACRAAIIRIENGSYGICKETKKLIPRERLLIVPHTQHSVEGKEIVEKRGKKVED